MAQKRDNLLKLLEFIKELCNEPGNEWFRDRLLSCISSTEIESFSPEIRDIYEYCIKKIVKENAENFYEGFCIGEIKQKLINDFVRMEQYRREDKFEDFCLAIHQQLEAVINYLCEKDIEFCRKIIMSKDEVAYKFKNAKTKIVESFALWKLILTTYKSEKDAKDLFRKPLIEWQYNYKLKAVLYYFYFNQKIWNLFDFNDIYSLAEDLYQARNLSHRGGYEYDKQKERKKKVLGDKYKYYFRFLGFLEDFITKVNDNISKDRY